MRNGIEIGDIVQVNINAAGMTLIDRAEVLGIPAATGDSWKFRAVKSGKIIYTSEPCTIYLQDPYHEA